MTETRTCLRCSDEFIVLNDNDARLFCSSKCRYKAWNDNGFKKKNPQVSLMDTVEDLKYEMYDARKQSRNIHQNLERVEHEYQDWEDRIVAVENRLQDLEKELELEEATLPAEKPVKIVDFMDVLGDLVDTK